MPLVNTKNFKGNSPPDIKLKIFRRVARKLLGDFLGDGESASSSSSEGAPVGGEQLDIDSHQHLDLKKQVLMARVEKKK